MPEASKLQINQIRSASRLLIRELGFLNKTIANTNLSASAVHAILEIGLKPGITAKELSQILLLEKSTISRLIKSLEAKGEITQSKSNCDGRAYPIHLTEKGSATFHHIDEFGNNQVRNALKNVSDQVTQHIATSLSTYASALSQVKRDKAPDQRYRLVEGYQTGMIGDIAAMHARTHAALVGFDHTFESLVSSAMSEFVQRINKPINNSWNLLEGDKIVGSISIDGEDLGSKVAHLRWFILSEHLRGEGIGKALLQKALEHCDKHDFKETQLWTLKGLEAARQLYEKFGFELVDEYIGEQWGKAVTEQKFVRRAP